MMIAIPNMSKPKGCKECQWHLDFYIGDEQVGGLCTITEKDDKENTCPLIEIDLVRCGECKHYYPYKHYDGRILGYYCQAPNQQTDFLEPTHYCSFGERRADEEMLL